MMGDVCSWHFSAVRWDPLDGCLPRNSRRGIADVHRFGNIKRTSKQTRHRQMASPITSA